MATRKIFIADDDEVVLDSLGKLLRLSGFEVESTKDSREAVSRIKSSRPDIILLDLLMPHLGGLEICEMLNQDPQTQGIPIIIISAIGGYTDIKKAYKLGVVGYFTKPYDFQELLKEISKDIYYKGK
jgi:two-component system chemotaxis response regulator CheY